jgi:hypothetical protein
MQDGFTDSFRGDRTGMDTNTPKAMKPVDQRNTFAEFGGIQRGFLACRPGPDHHQVK